MTEYTFHKLLCYLYTDEIPPVSADKCLNLLELANRLCLPRLLNLIECRVIENLTKISQIETSEAVELCLSLLESVKVRFAQKSNKEFSNEFSIFLASQCSPISRMVHVIFVRQLQQHLSSRSKVPKTTPSGKSRIFA